MKNMVNLKVLEKFDNVWGSIAFQVNNWIDKQKLANYLNAAETAKINLDFYLKAKNLKYKILVRDDTEYYRWVKVVIEVYLDLPFDECLDMMEELDDVLQKDMGKMERSGIYLQTEELKNFNAQ